MGRKGSIPVTSSGPSRHRSLAILAVLLITLFGSTTSAGADGYGPEAAHHGPVPLPDDAGASYCFGGTYGDGNLQTKAHEAEIYLDSRTATYRIFESCNPNDTDMAFHNLNLPPGVVGARTCELGAFGVCVAGSIIIDANEVFVIGANCAPSYGMDAATAINGELVHTIRHEVGHAQGLHHGTASTITCTHGPPNVGGTDSMVSGVAFHSLIYFSYHDHHACHINAWIVFGVWQNTCT
jgi:hypothetical protein